MKKKWLESSMNYRQGFAHLSCTFLQKFFHLQAQNHYCVESGHLIIIQRPTSFAKLFKQGSHQPYTLDPILNMSFIVYCILRNHSYLLKEMAYLLHDWSIVHVHDPSEIDKKINVGCRRIGTISRLNQMLRNGQNKKHRNQKN